MSNDDNSKDSKLSIEQLTTINNQTLRRLENLEKAFDALYAAVLEIASATKTYGGARTKLEEVQNLRVEHGTLRGCVLGEP